MFKIFSGHKKNGKLAKRIWENGSIENKRCCKHGLGPCHGDSIFHAYYSLKCEPLKDMCIRDFSAVALLDLDFHCVLTIRIFFVKQRSSPPIIFVKFIQNLFTVYLAEKEVQNALLISLQGTIFQSRSLSLSLCFDIISVIILRSRSRGRECLLFWGAQYTHKHICKH